MKRGFTLAELLGVLTLLAIIVILAVPAVAKSVSRGKQNLYKSEIESFKKAAADWMANHVLELPDGNINTTITLGCLKAEGLLDASIENPVSGKQFPNDMTIIIRSASNQYIYEVNEKSGTVGAELPAGKCHFDPKAIEK